MQKLGRAALKKLIRDRLDELAAGPNRTATRQRHWRLQRRTALELLEVGRPLHLTPSDISNRGAGCYGADIVFSPFAWEIYGRLWIACACHPASLDAEGIFRDHDERSRHVQVSRQAVPLVVHRYDYQSTSGTMRQTDFLAVFGQIPAGARKKNELLTVEWKVMLAALSRRIEQRGSADADVTLEWKFL